MEKERRKIIAIKIKHNQRENHGAYSSARKTEAINQNKAREQLSIRAIASNMQPSLGPSGPPHDSNHGRDYLGRIEVVIFGP